MRRAQCLSQDPLHTSGGGSRGRGGWGRGGELGPGGRTSKKYTMPKNQMPDGMVAGSAKRPAPRPYKVEIGHCLTGQYLHWTKNAPPPPGAGAGVRHRPGTTSSRSAPSGNRSRRSCGRRC